MINSIKMQILLFPAIFFVDLRGVFRKLTSKTNTTRASVIGIIPKKVALTVEKSYTNFTKTFPTCKFLLRIITEFSECGEFDSKLADACETVDWTPRYYFDRESGQCRMFWSSGCTSESANNFRNLSSCQERCEQRQSELRAHPSRSDFLTVVVLNSKEETFPSDSPSRCLKPKESGKCSETYPAYYYNLEMHRCEPFVYSGCGGNSNRFLTLRQCQSVCSKFSGLSRRYSIASHNLIWNFLCKMLNLDKFTGRCERFWYSGCGGNENRFYDLVTCESVCRAVMTTTFSSNALHPKVCFQPIQKGKCMNKTRRSVQRWAYDHVKLRCVTFDYAGCNGNENRFATEFACNMNCKGLKLPLNERCMNYPNWGYCNHLNYRWFYNLTKGTCQQFLWGGCDDGNENRFETFEICQQSCEIPTENVCMEPLDRGHWCEPMSSRYYYNIDSKLCKGFHYTGCGNSRNIFMTKQEYKGVKPPEKHVVVVHKVLNAASIPNLKTDDQWMEYGQCVGFRYSSPNLFLIRLNVKNVIIVKAYRYILQTLTSTDGDEKCFLVHPWLKGLHLYSWFFTIDQRPDIISKQSLNQTTAALIILPPNDCHSIC
ncbi:unnamed protein product [Thelazia callipaeda]|uniref:Kunitz n=1 Tax=Thelazia callipaeda TaxID=103827 RepID=A0A0N5CR95_THECL|nr:unnamed protein product [Thelazia callipaeda]